MRSLSLRAHLKSDKTSSVPSVPMKKAGLEGLWARKSSTHSSHCGHLRYLCYLFKDVNSWLGCKLKARKLPTHSDQFNSRLTLNGDGAQEPFPTWPVLARASTSGYLLTGASSAEQRVTPLCHIMIVPN